MATTANLPADIAAVGSAISEEEVSALLENDERAGVRPCDFTAQRINRTQLPMLQIVAKSFAERMGVALTTLLGRDATVQFIALDSAKAAELQAALPVPGSLAVIRLKPLTGSAFVSVEPSLLLTLLDGFFGGSGRAAGDPSAAVAPAAQRFLALMLRSFAAEWSTAWSPIAPLELELVKQEVNPRLMQLGAPQEPMIVLRFSVEFGARSGRMDWLVPELMLAPLREALAEQGSNAPASRKQEVWGPTLGIGLQEAQVEIRAVLSEVAISLRELVRLMPGDVIPIDNPQQATLLAGEVAIHRGRFGLSQGHNALKIISGATA